VGDRGRQGRKGESRLEKVMEGREIHYTTEESRPGEFPRDKSVNIKLRERSPQKEKSGPPNNNTGRGGGGCRLGNDKEKN